MNTELLKKVCGIDIPDLNKKALRQEPMKLTASQVERLTNYVKEHVKGFNWGILKDIEAYRVTYRRQWLKTICVVWRQTPGCGMSHYFKEVEFAAIAG